MKPKTLRSTLVCEKCLTKQFIYRIAGESRKKNHPKHLYCYVCKDRTRHFENITYEMLIRLKKRKTTRKEKV